MHSSSGLIEARAVGVTSPVDVSGTSAAPVPEVSLVLGSF